MPPPMMLIRRPAQLPREALPAAAADLLPFKLPASPPTPIVPRQAATTTATIPALYGSADSSPTPGAVAGITLGAVGGFLLVLYLIYVCINIGNSPERAESSVTGSAVIERKRAHRHSHHHHRRSHGEATVEVRRTSRVVPSAVIVEEAVRGGRGGGESIIIEEAIRRDVSRGPRGPRGPPRVVHDSDDDEIVVMEEHSPPRRRRSRVRSVERRSSVYERRDSSSRAS
ncbi:hypothetical protein QBC34DRAFT_81806 [Podospora aff. communis PSN243]|uniref:Uncharacterized protein n=1 Tax=Podospora aff. communis PSN243 TaxID=3040156 RepID=A0AAV9GR06_9PEZI|nr:hypothetical protein QBC34DRAFT_81806 [Podospora aff. communis PSN243]